MTTRIPTSNNRLRLTFFFFFLILFPDFTAYSQVSVYPSLISEDHTAEGFMLTISDGSLRHFFRLDPGYNGHHIGNNSRIVQRASYDQGQTWTVPTDIFEDEWDDRNVHGGMTQDDRIILFFRRYNAINKLTVSTNYIYSDDFGNTWSDPNIVETGIADNPGTHKMIFVPGKGYMQSFYAPWMLQLRFSPDGTDWSHVGYTWDYTVTREFKVSEACFINLDGGKMLGLIRDERYSNFFQVTSPDYGTTWSDPVRTNIAMPFFTPSPQLFYDQSGNQIIVIANDRRGLNGYPMNDAEFYIYATNPENAWNDALSWQLAEKFPRPFPNYRHFYGYPTYAKLEEGRYLIVFTEAYTKDNNKEQADFYQFELNTNTYIPLANAVKHEHPPILRLFPNPTTEGKITAKIDQLHYGERIVLELFNSSGQLVWQQEDNAFDGYITEIDISGYQHGLYFFRVHSNEGVAVESIIVQ
jgi:hypothetical protein